MRIQQVMPAASGWRVMWVDAERVEVQPMIAWALVDEEGGDGDVLQALYPVWRMDGIGVVEVGGPDCPDYILQPGDGKKTIRRLAQECREMKARVAAVRAEERR